MGKEPRLIHTLFGPENVLMEVGSSRIYLTVQPYELGPTVNSLLERFVGKERGDRSFTDCGGGGSENTRWFSVQDLSSPGKRSKWLRQVANQLAQELRGRGIKVVIKEE